MLPACRSTALRAARRSLSRPIEPVSGQQSRHLRRLLSSLAVLEQRDGKFNVSSLAAVSAAKKLGGSVCGFIAGSGTKSVAEEIAKTEGLDKVIYVDNAAYNYV